MTDQDKNSDLRVLIVEDYAVNQKVALRMLQKLGIVADCVENGQLAIEAMATQNYDMVFMDCEMPVMNGFEATAHIRAKEEGSDQRTTIIAMTAHYGSQEERRCFDAGMDAFVEKPIRLDSLAKTIDANR